MTNSTTPDSLHRPRRALITGASRGIGHLLARTLAEEGCDLIVTGSDAGRLDATVEDFRRHGWRCDGQVLPLEDPAALAAGLARLVRDVDRLDMLVLNAAVGGVRVPMVEYPDATWRMVFEANVHANRTILATLQPLLLAAPAARIVFMTTGVARRWKANTGAYAASKAAMDALAQIYAVEMAATAIRSNIVNPGPTRTEMRAAAFPTEDPAQVKPPETLLPLLLHLLSDAAPHGQLIDADEHPLVRAAVAALPVAPNPQR